MANQPIHGKNLMLFFDFSGTSRPVGFQKSFKIDFTRDMSEFSSKDSGDDKEFFGGMKSYTMTLDAVASNNNNCSYYNLFDLYNCGCTVSWVAAEKTGTSPNYCACTTSGQRMSGTTLINTLSVTADLGDVVTYSGTFQGTGKVKRY